MTEGVFGFLLVKVDVNRASNIHLHKHNNTVNVPYYKVSWDIKKFRIIENFVS